MELERDQERTAAELFLLVVWFYIVGPRSPYSSGCSPQRASAAGFPLANRPHNRKEGTARVAMVLQPRENNAPPVIGGKEASGTTEKKGTEKGERCSFFLFSEGESAASIFDAILQPVTGSFLLFVLSLSQLGSVPNWKG